MTRTEFLREQTVSGANKCKRAPMPSFSVANEKCSIPERKALGLKHICENMPVYIGPMELIVGTRTFFSSRKGNEDGHDFFEYGLYTRFQYINEKELELFGEDGSFRNKTHYTPDYSILLKNGVDGIISKARNNMNNPDFHDVNRDFLSGVIISYTALKNLILRYCDEATSLAALAEGEEKQRLEEIAKVCNKISSKAPDTFREAVQLLWFGHLAVIMENFEAVNYGRLDVILYDYLKDTPMNEARQLVECLLLKMYDQVDINTSYLNKYSAQLIVTLGGVLPNGENAVNDVTFLFLDAIDKIRLPEPEFNLRINSKNPPEFLDKAAHLTVTGCNFVSYYNDDLFVESLVRSGIPIEYARDYGFDLCQDINIPGKGDFWYYGSLSLIYKLLEAVHFKRDFKTFDELMIAIKKLIVRDMDYVITRIINSQKSVFKYRDGDLDGFFNGVKNENMPISYNSNGPMSPLPFLSALYHGSLEKGLDVVYEPYPIKEKGFYFSENTETINALAAIKMVVFEKGLYTLDEVYTTCQSNFEGENGKIMKNILWNCPKWGNDDDYVDLIAKDILEFCLNECKKYKTFSGGKILGGIHSPHPVLAGEQLMATPEGRSKGVPTAVTLTPESGTMKNGPTAALSSAAKIDPMLVQWNYCVMVNYFSSVFKGNDGKETFKKLLNGYFKKGGLQHQPNVTDVEELKKAQLEPEKYKDLIVRLWGVSAHFVDLPKELQDEMISRFA